MIKMKKRYFLIFRRITSLLRTFIRMTHTKGPWYKMSPLVNPNPKVCFSSRSFFTLWNFCTHKIAALQLKASKSAYHHDFSIRYTFFIRRAFFRLDSMFRALTWWKLKRSWFVGRTHSCWRTTVWSSIWRNSRT